MINRKLLDDATALAGPSTVTAKKNNDKTADIYLEGFIGGNWGEITSKTFNDTLNGLGRLKRMTIYLNSKGGDTSEGFAIYNAIVRNPTPSKRIIADSALSIAAVILQAGTERLVYDSTFVMLHPVQVSYYGSIEGLLTTLDRMQKVEDNIHQVFLSRTRQELSTIKDMMTKETWLNGQEIVDKGFADKVISPTGQLENCANFYEIANMLYNNVPAPKPVPKPRLAKFIAKHGCLFPTF